jgi:hypothetical protein
MEVRVENVRVSFLSGQATIENFTLGNPMGFRSPRAMNVASVSVNLELTSLLSIRSSSAPQIVEPDITTEKRGGTDNVKPPARGRANACNHFQLAGCNPGFFRVV